MKPLTIFLASLVLPIVAWIIAERRNRKLARKIKKQEEIIERYIKADDDTEPTYVVATTMDGRFGVCRNSTIDGFLHITVIKIFTDPDQDFNRREAEELVEILNSK